jgi:pre-rRNA-processing protein IPI3
LFYPSSDSTILSQTLDNDVYSEEELGRDHSYFIQPSSSASGHPSTAVLQSKVAELETEVGLLREQLGKAKGVNDVMWENVVKRVLGSEEKVEDARRKRSRS